MVSEGGDEDDLGEGIGRAQPRRHGQAVEAWHLDVENDDVRLELTNQAQSLVARASLGDELDLRNAGQGLPQARQGQGFIVRDQDLHATTSNGNSRSTRHPPSGSGPYAKEAAGP